MPDHEASPPNPKQSGSAERTFALPADSSDDPTFHGTAPTPTDSAEATERLADSPPRAEKCEPVPSDKPSSQTVRGETPESTSPSGKTMASFASLAQERMPLPQNLDTLCIGDYEVVGEVARGGMGIVYRAVQRSLHRIVALKMVLGGILADSQTLQRLRTEAEASARLDHPNIVPIYEIGEFQGQPFFTMKWIEGGNLHQWIVRRFPQQGSSIRQVLSRADQMDVAGTLAQVARAVHHAHQRGVLHRDLKPANILLHHPESTSSGMHFDPKSPPDRPVEGHPPLHRLVPMVSDFGLAKWVQGDGQATHTGVVGTPSYMSPEQAENSSALTIAADVYSLGAILYELLTGRPPFKGASPVDTIRQLLEKEPTSPRTLQPALDRDLETICLKCLEKNPGRRYASAEDLAADLDRWRRGEAIAARPLTRTQRLWRRCRRNPALACLTLVAGAGLAATVLLAFVLAYHRGQALTESKRAREKQVVALRRATAMALNRGLTFCDEGDLSRGLLWLAHSLEIAPEEAADLERVIRCNLHAWGGQCPPPRHLWPGIGHLYLEPLFSPDGRILLTEFQGRENRLRLWSTTDGKALGEPLDLPYQIQLARFDDAGKRLLTLCRGQLENQDVTSLHLWNAADGKAIACLVQDHPGELEADFSPDGRSILVMSRGKNNASRLWHAADGAPIRDLLPAPGKRRTTYHFSAGAKVLIRSEEPEEKVDPAVDPPLIQVEDLRTGTLVGPSLRGHRFLQASPDGEVFVAANAQGRPEIRRSRDGKLLFEPATSAPLEQVLWGSDFLLLSAGDVTLWRAGSPARDDWKSVKLSDLPALELGSGVDPDILWFRTEEGLHFYDRRRQQPLTDAPWQDVDPGQLVHGPEGYLAQVDFAGKAKVWCLRPKLHLIAESFRADQVRFHPRRPLLLVTVGGRSQWFDPATGRYLAAPFLHEGEARVEIDPPGRNLLIVDSWLRLWNADPSVLLQTRPLPHRRLPFPKATAARFTPDGKALELGDAAGAIRLFDLQQGRWSERVRQVPGPVLALGPADDGKAVVVFRRPDLHGPSSALLARFAADAVQPTEVVLLGTNVGDVRFSPDGSRLAVLPAEEPGRLPAHARAVLWDVLAVKPAGPNLAPAGPVGLFSPDGNSWLGIRRDRDPKTDDVHGLVRLWSAADALPLGETTKIGNPLAAGYGRGEVGAHSIPLVVESAIEGDHWARVLQPGTEVEPTLLEKEDGSGQALWVGTIVPGLDSIALNDEGTLLAKALVNDGVQLWDLRTGLRAGPNRGGARLLGGVKIYAVSFSPDGNLLLARSDHRLQPAGADLGLRRIDKVYLVDLKTGHLLGPPIETSIRTEWNGVPLNNRHLFDPAGKHLLLAAAGHDGLDLLTLPRAEQASKERFLLWVQTLTGLELDPTGRSIPLEPTVWRDRFEKLQSNGGSPMP